MTAWLSAAATTACAHNHSENYFSLRINFGNNAHSGFGQGKTVGIVGHFSGDSQQGF